MGYPPPPPIPSIPLNPQRALQHAIDIYVNGAIEVDELEHRVAVCLNAPLGPNGPGKSETR